MHGDLSDTTVPAICLSLASQAATGRLVIRGPEGPGTITLREGAIADATSPLPRARLRERLTGGGHLDELTMARVVHELRDGSTTPSAGAPPDDGTLARGLVDRELTDPDLMDRLLIAPVVDALFELFARRGGEYRFEVEGPGTDDDAGSGLHLEVERALVEVERRSAELWSLPAVTRSWDTVPLLLLDHPATPADFDADALTVLTGIDDDSNLGEIARRVGYGIFDVARVIAALYERGVVALTQPQAGLRPQEARPADRVQAGAGDAAGPRHAESSQLPADHDPSEGTPVDPVRADGPAPEATPGAPEAPEPTPAATPAATAASDAAVGTGAAASTSQSASTERAGSTDRAGSTERTGSTDRARSTERTGSTDSAGSIDRASSTNPAAAANGARPRRADDADDTDVSEFLRELSSLANRDDSRTRRTTSPAQSERAGGRAPRDAGTAASGDEPRARSAGDDPRARSTGDDDAEAPEDRRHQGPAPPSDDGRRKRRGFFGRG